MLWPLVTRRRFVRELEQQGEAYRKNISRLEADVAIGDHALARERAQFVEIVDQLKYYSDAEVQHQLINAYTEREPTNLHVLNIEHSYEHDSTMFFVRVTNFLLKRVAQALNRDDARALYIQLSNEIARQFMVKYAESTR